LANFPAAALHREGVPTAHEEQPLTPLERRVPLIAEDLPFQFVGSFIR